MTDGIWLNPDCGDDSPAASNRAASVRIKMRDSS